MNYLLKYYEEIEKGNIIAGAELKTMLKRLVDDLSNPRYFFDETPGNLRINFIETFCRHTKSPFNSKPFILELWEKALIQVAYGFKMKATGLRRFDEVLLLIAGKNGKTTSVAGLVTDSKVYDAIKQSQSTKAEPLIFIITTEGNVVGGFLDKKLEYCRKMLKGDIKDETLLPWLYAQDSTEESIMIHPRGKRVILV